MLRYGLAIGIALAIVSSVYAYAVSLRRSIERELRDEFVRQRQAGELPEELADHDFEGNPLEGLGTMLPPELERRIVLADSLLGLASVWIPLVFGLCLGVAWVIGWRDPTG